MGERARGRGQTHPRDARVVASGGGGEWGDGDLRNWGRGAVRTGGRSARATGVSGGAQRAAGCRIDPRRRVESKIDRPRRRGAAGGHRPDQFRGRRVAASYRLASRRPARLAGPRVRPAVRVPGRALARAACNPDRVDGTRVGGDLAGAVRASGADAGTRFARDRAHELPHDLCRFGRGRGADRDLAPAGRSSAGRSPVRTASRCRWSARSRRSTGSARTRRGPRAP
jgi:hypothetical protein